MKKNLLRMSFEDCARAAAAATRRFRQGGKKVETRSVFKGAEQSRLTLDWSAGLQPADDELRWNILRMRARARELARNNAYAKTYLRLLTDNVIGPTGIKFQSQVRDNNGKLNAWINDRVEKAWAAWSQDVTIGAPLSLTAFSAQALRSVARDGEAFVRLWRGFEGNRFRFGLEAIDPDQVDEMLNRPLSERAGNQIRMGIEMDGLGRPVAYHAWDSPLYTAGSAPDRRRIRIAADEIIHLYDPERVNQSRGLTWYAAAMYSLRMLDGYEEAELVASRVSASKMGFFVQKDTTSAISSETTSISMEANPGQLEVLPPGYELQEFDPTHPAQEFAQFVKTQLRKVSGALGVPYNMLANDLESVNYSSMRAGRLTAIDTWRSLQHWWITAFQKRVHAEWLNMAVLSGELAVDQRAADKLLEAKWTPRGWPGVDPQKDMEAAIAGIPTGLATRTEVLAEQGLDFEEVIHQLAEEKKLADELGVEIAGPKPPGGTESKEKKPKSEDDETEKKPSADANRIVQAINRIGNGSLINGHR